MQAAAGHRPRPVAQRVFPLRAALLVGAAVGWAVLWFVHTLGYWEDDAYIHLEFARSLARGAGFVFNGSVVYGDTSPLWVWLLAATHLVIPDWMAAGKALAALAALFAMAGAFEFSKNLVRGLDPADRNTFAAAMLLLFVVNPYFGYWAFSGMEALGAAGLVCWGLLAATGTTLQQSIAPSRFLLGCLCAGIAPLLRPEMAFFTALLGVLLLLRWINLPARPGRKLALFFSGFALVAGPGLAWAIYALRTFGSILPNTNAAKRAPPDSSVIGHLVQIYAMGFPLVLLGLLSLAVWSIAAQRRKSSVPSDALASSLSAGGWLLFVWTALNGIFYVLNHTYVQTRYIFVTAPVLTIALLAIARQLWPRLFVAGVVLGSLFGVIISLLTTWPLIRNKIGVDREYAALASFLRTLPPTGPVAYYSIGEAAFLSEHPIIDFGGITRPGVIPFLFDRTDDRRLWWAHEQGARYAVLDHMPEPGSTLLWSHRLPSTGWFLNPHRYLATETLNVWALPPTPTLPLPPDMPVSHAPEQFR